MILKIRRRHTAQVTLIEDDDVIETLAADRADDQRRAGIPGECAPTFPKPLTLCISVSAWISFLVGAMLPVRSKRGAVQEAGTTAQEQS